MAGPNVKFTIQGDNSSAIRAFNQVNAKVSGVASNLSGNLKGALAGAFSVAAIGAAVKSTISYADNIDKTAQRLGVTTEYVQVLQRVARDTGKEFGVMEKAITNVADAAEDALSGDTNKKNAFAKLGIDEKELKTLNKKDLLTQVASGSQGLSRQGAESAYSAIFGKKDAGAMLAVSGQLANPSGVEQTLKDKGQLISDADIEAIAETQDAFEDLAATMKSRMAPVITGVVDAVTWFVNGVIDLTELFGTAIGAFLGLIQNFDIQAFFVSFGELFVNSIKAILNNAWDILRGKKTIGEAVQDVGNTIVDGEANVLNKSFGEDNVAIANQVIEDKLLEQAKRDSDREAARQAKRDARQQERTDLEGPVNRTGRPQKQQTLKPEDLKSSASPYLSIGGIAGINTQYRIERINKDMLEQLIEINQTLKEADSSSEEQAL